MEHIKSLFINFGYPDENIIVTGSPNYERVFRVKRTLEKEGIEAIRRKNSLHSENNPIVVFIDEHSNAGDQRLFKSSDYTFSGRSGANNRNEIMAGEILDALTELEISANFVVRLHPKSNKDDYTSLVSEIRRFSYDSDPYELIFCADLVVGMTSMLLMEAFLLGKPVISAIPRESEKEWAPSGLLDYVGCVTNSSDLKHALDLTIRGEQKSQIPEIFTESNPIGNIKNFILGRLSPHE